MLRAGEICVSVLLAMTVLQQVSAAAYSSVRVQVIDDSPQLTEPAFLSKTITNSSSSKMTDEQKKAVVAKHNQLRSTTDAKYQPCTAADMEAMVWDDTLAAESQAWADACVGDHAPGAGSDFGENLFMSYPDTSYTTDSLAGGVTDWYSEIVDSVWGVDDKKGTCKPGTTVGHYWQVIWAKSKHVGCGVAACTKSLTISGADHGSGVLMVCRYDPPASLKGAGDTNSLPYILGKPCAACPDHCLNGLCTATPIRCLDKLGGDNTISIGGKKYDSCKKLVKDYSANSNMPWCTQLAQMMKAEDTCALSCGKCTVPTGIGREYCDGWDHPPKAEEEEDAGAEESGGNTNDAAENQGEAQSQDKTQDKNDKGSKNNMKELMRAKMREKMKSKMKSQMGGKNTGSIDDSPSGSIEDEPHGHGELGGHGDGELGGDWDTWHDSGDANHGWEPFGGSHEHPWGSSSGQWTVVSKQQMVSDVASFRPPQEPERETARAPMLPPLKISARKFAATLP